MGNIIQIDHAREKRKRMRGTLRWTTSIDTDSGSTLIQLTVREHDQRGVRYTSVRISQSLSYLLQEGLDETHLSGVTVRHAFKHLTTRVTLVRTIGDLLRTAYAEDLAVIHNLSKEIGVRTRMSVLDPWRQLFDQRLIPQEVRVAIAAHRRVDVEL